MQALGARGVARDEKCCKGLGVDHVERKRAYWRKVIRLTTVLLGAWFVVSFVGPWFARDLEGLGLGAFPLNFWMAAQGALIAYVLIIAIYAWAMDRLDERYSQASRDETHE